MKKYIKYPSVQNFKKCPPGVICLENMTMFFIVFMVALLIYYFSTQTQSQSQTSRSHTNTNTKTSEKIIVREPGIAMVPNYPYTNQPPDVLLNPYTPPLKDERYFVPIPARVPINISTNIGAVDTNYRQVGLLKPVNGSKHILPLMGRPLLVNRDTWQYYTMSDQNNSIKLPILKKGKSCTGEYGCDSLYSGDIVLVEGYDERFRVTLYDNDTVRYIPY
jgi:Family of unknown function (DUF5755)